jgi:arylformamidase
LLGELSASLISGHLCGVALVTDCEKDFGVSAAIVKGGLCISGMHELMPVRLSGGAAI